MGPQPAANAEVGTILAAKARESASGILELDGDPAGAIHLDGGAITFAWSSWCRPLGDRLRELAPTAAPAPHPAWDGRAVQEYCAALGSGGYVVLDALEEASRSHALAAVTALTMPLEPSAQPPLIRFAQPGRCWASGPCRLAADEVLARAAEHAQLIDSFGISPSSKVSLCDPQRPMVVVRRDEWAVASRIDRGLPLRDLAAGAGIALYDALESVGELVSAGLCRVTSRSTPARQWSSAGIQVPSDPQGPDVLHRVLDGLRRLS